MQTPSRQPEPPLPTPARCCERAGELQQTGAQIRRIFRCFGALPFPAGAPLPPGRRVGDQAAAFG